MDDNDWYHKIIQSYENPPAFHNGERLPSFPTDQIQANTTGQAGEPTLREAFVFYQDCLRTFGDIGIVVSGRDKLLDFGVGWGRIARFFLRELPKSQIYGIDVTDAFIAICKETFDSPNFFTCSPFPPTDLDSSQFKVVVAYSVFSHLSEDACYAWMEEFDRILMPGGVVAATTRGKPFLDFCESLRQSEQQGYLKALSLMFEDFDEARNRYDRGEFVHSNADGVAGGGSMNSSFYGETFIPESYAESAYSDLFEFKKFLFQPPRQTHPILFFQKRD